MQKNEDRNRSNKTGPNSVRESGRRRTNRMKRYKEKALRREISAILLATLIAAFFILTEPGKGMISAVTGTSNAPEVSAAATTQEIAPLEPRSEETPAAVQPEETAAAVQPEEPSAAESSEETPAASEPAVEEEAQIPAAEKEDQQGPPSEDPFTLDMVPPYSGNAYADINGDVPFFTEEEMTSEAFHEYWPLDELGRCTGAYACVGPETLPRQKRGDISEVKPTGWNTNRYSDIDGEMLFNRCHLIGHLLTGQDANERNLVTGTRYMNTEGMLPFEESVRMYVEGTRHHVMYRVRPYFEGDNLVCSGVLMEARSVEDPRVQFCAFCYNVQPGFEIDYTTGDNRRAVTSKDEEIHSIIADPEILEEADARQAGEEADALQTSEVTDFRQTAAVTDSLQTAAEAPQEEAAREVRYILNTNTRKFHLPYCSSVQDIKDKNKQESAEDRESLIDQGYTPCKLCSP